MSSGTVSGAGQPDGRPAGGGPGPVHDEWHWNRVLTPPVALRIVVVVGLLVWAYWVYVNPFNGLWPSTWSKNDAWSHGYLIPVMALVIAHYRLKEHNPQGVEPCLWGLGLILAGAMIRIWSRLMMIGYPAEVSFLVVAAGIVLWLLGWRMFRALWVPVAYLVLMIPWDPKYYDLVAGPLQRLSAAAAEVFLRLVGMPVFREGNVLNVRGEPLTIAEACAGLRLLVAFLALGVFMAYLYRRPLWERLVIILSSVPIAVLCNFVRVTLMAVASDRILTQQDALKAGQATWATWFPRIDPGWQFSFGYQTVGQLEQFRRAVLDPASALHQSFGFAMLGLAFVLLYLELGLIDRLLISDEKGESPAEAKAT